MSRFVHVLSIFLSWVFFGGVMVTTGAYAGECENRASAAAQRAYTETYNRVLDACLNGGGECRVDADCAFGFQCVSGRCVTRPTSCIRNCVERYANGDCRKFGVDFCGFDPVCTKKCQERYSSGDCRQYSQDFCGEKPASCVARCTERYSNGDCRTYGADYCGPVPACTPYCVERYPNGECRTWGPDRCTGGVGEY